MSDRTLTPDGDLESIDAAERSCRKNSRAADSAEVAGRHGASVTALTYVLFVMLLVGAVIAVFRTTLLPDRFLYDSERLQQFIANPGLIVNDGSYRGTATLWRLVSSGGSEPVVGLVTFLVFVGTLFAVVVPSRIVTATVGPYVLALAAVVLAGVYASGYTKEFFVVLVVLVVLKAPRGIAGELAGVAAISAYAYGVRPYWAIVGGLYVALRLLLRGRTPIRSFLAVAVLALVVLTLAFPIATGFTIDGYRRSIVDVLSVMPDSAIAGPFTDGGFISQVGNALSVFVGLQLPVHLLTNSAVQALGAVVIVLLWSQFWMSLRRNDRIGGFPRDVVLERCAALLFAVLVAQSTFEPDYGSYLRHLIPLMPAAMYVALAGRARSSNTAQPLLNAASSSTP